ncbi:hypothetical protein D1872_253990 [compost metagenome]
MRTVQKKDGFAAPQFDRPQIAAIFCFTERLVGNKVGIGFGQPFDIPLHHLVGINLIGVYDAGGSMRRRGEDK